MVGIIAVGENGAVLDEKSAMDELSALLDSLCPPIKGKRLFPSSEIQQAINLAYYINNHSDDLGFDTIGVVDKLLPKAIATDYNGSGHPILEIGPGNFHVARTILETLNPSISYTCSDITDSLIKHCPTEVRFIQQDPMSALNSLSTQTNVLMIELLDDTKTEFYARRNGSLHRSYACIDTRETKVDLANGETVSAKQIHDRIEEGELNALIEVSQKSISYFTPDEGCFPNSGFEPVIIDDSVQAKKINRLIEELVSELSMQTDDFISVPVQGIQMLWEMRDKPVSFNIFDYGYTDPKACLKINYFNGQMTAPVNFLLLEMVAKELGYNAELQHDDSYITQHLGIETVSLLYVYKALERTKLNPLNLDMMFFGHDNPPLFERAIRKLQPDADINYHTIKGYKIEKSEWDSFLSAFNNVDSKMDPPVYKTGRFNLKATSRCF